MRSQSQRRNRRTGHGQDARREQYQDLGIALTDARGVTVKLSLIEGLAYEATHVVELLDNPPGLIVVGDKEFDASSCASNSKNTEPGIAPSPASSTTEKRHRNKLYRQRYRLKNYFCRFKHRACSGTKRGKLARHLLSIIEFTSVIELAQI